MSRSVQPTNYRRDPVHISEVLAECFRETESTVILTAWADAQEQIPGQMELPICSGTCPGYEPWCCIEAENPLSGSDSAARPGADWGTWEVPC